MRDRSRLRVVLLTQNDVFHIPFSLRRFLERLDRESVEIVNLVVLPPMNEGLRKIAARMYRFLGPIDFVRRGIAFVAYRLLGRIGLTKRSLASLARGAHVDILDVLSVNAPDFVEYLKRESIDVLASISCPQILRKATLHAPTWGCINVHSGRLPEYRGLMPCFWAMYHGEDAVGVTVHTMDETIDGGKAVQRADVVIEETDTWDCLVRRCKEVGGELMARALGQIADGTETLVEYSGEGAYFSFPNRADVREFRRRGGRLL